MRKTGKPKARQPAKSRQPSGQSENRVLEIRDQLTMFRFVGGIHDGEDGAFDVQIVRMASEPVEKKHKETIKDGQKTTVEFTLDIYEALLAIGMPIVAATGQVHCTPSIAVKVWYEALRLHCEATQKKTESEPK